MIEYKLLFFNLKLKIMNKGKVIHKILKQIDWDLVLHCSRKLNLVSPKTTKADLIADLQLIVQNALETKKTVVATDQWVIYCELEEDNVCVEVVYTPMVVWADTLPSRNSKKSKIARIEDKLSLALEIENYEEADRLKKSIEDLQTKKKSAI